MAKMGYETNKRLIRDYHNRRETVTIGGKTFTVRSQLEKKIALYLDLLKANGHIKDWAFEQTTFRFPDDTYLVDFDVLENDGSFYYLEAKGYFDARSRRKLKLLNKYRPEVRLMLVLQSKSGLKKLGLAKKYCWRVCLLSELTRGNL
jgi:hypothetical protein